MTHEEKVEHFKEMVREHGYSATNAIPIICNVLWRRGYKVSPPYFWPFSIAFLVTGCCMWLGWLGLAWPLLYLLSNEPLRPFFYKASTAGLLFGLGMSAFWKWQALRLRLPTWRDYPHINPPCIDSSP